MGGTEESSRSGVSAGAAMLAATFVKKLKRKSKEQRSGLRGR